MSCLMKPVTRGSVGGSLATVRAGGRWMAATAGFAPGITSHLAMKSATIKSSALDWIPPRGMLRVLAEGLVMVLLLAVLSAAVLAMSVCAGLLGREPGPDGGLEPAFEVTVSDPRPISLSLP